MAVLLESRQPITACVSTLSVNIVTRLHKYVCDCCQNNRVVLDIHFTSTRQPHDRIASPLLASQNNIGKINFSVFFYFHRIRIRNVVDESDKSKAYDALGVQFYITT